MDAVMIACTDNNARGMIFLRAHERERNRATIFLIA
jgi:hypothetical protein